MYFMNDSILFRAFTFIFRELIIDVLRFPVWWYSTGTVNVFRRIGHEIADWGARLSLRILLRNMFKPMYGDYTRSGRAISFFMRLMVFGAKSIVFVIWTVILSALGILWLVLPLAIVYLIYLNITGTTLPIG